MHIEGLKALPARDIEPVSIICYPSYGYPSFGLIVIDGGTKMVLIFRERYERGSSPDNLSTAESFGASSFIVYPNAAVVPYFDGAALNQTAHGSLVLIGDRLTCPGYRRFSPTLFDVESGQVVQCRQTYEVNFHSWDILVRHSYEDLHSVFKVRGEAGRIHS